MSYCFDLIIVGGGAAGLRVGIETLKKTPSLRCCILEKYGYIGGRVVTFRKKIPEVGNIYWENGAGRISIHHHRVLHLFKEYGLTYIPLDATIDFIKDDTGNKQKHNDIISANIFSNFVNVYIEPLSNLHPDILSTHTLKELLDKSIGPALAKRFYLEFPYYSEIHTLRADIAINVFQHEMKSNDGFGVCKEGLSSLTDSMATEFITLGGRILTNIELLSVKNMADNYIILSCKNRILPINYTYVTKACVLALHQAALKDIQGINLPVLHHLKMMPLLRIYAIFPTKKGVSWFSGLNKIVTDSPIRYFIPVDSKRGIVMISYTDGADADYWFKQQKAGGDINVQDLVMSEIRTMFPDRIIPDPIFFKQHPWYDGCTYWLPGKYCVEKESFASLHPLPNEIPHLFMCGESFAVKQCWIESALTQADNLVAHKTFRTVMNKLHVENNDAVKTFTI